MKVGGIESGRERWMRVRGRKDVVCDERSGNEPNLGEMVEARESEKKCQRMPEMEPPTEGDEVL